MNGLLDDMYELYDRCNQWLLFKNNITTTGKATSYFPGPY